MQMICAPGATVPGYDVSHWNPSVNHMAMAQNGKKFCVVKGNEGNGIVDELFALNWRVVKESGLFRAAYTFFHPSQDPSSQADLLFKLVGTLTAGDLPCAIDLESMDGMKTADVRTAAYEYLLRIESLTGKTPLIYSGPYFLRDQVAADERFHRFPLWISHYQTQCPLIPPPWTTWNFWQYTDSGGLDLDTFNGTIDQLKALGG